MRRLTREELRQEAYIYASRRIERLEALNRDAISGRASLRNPRDLAGFMAQFYERYMSRHCVISP
jgi:hypothetical protein